MINSRFCVVKNRKIHYLVAGKGAPIVLLHPSPSSSKMMLPLINTLAPHFTVIAPDTPGYGQSEALPKHPEHLKDYCTFFQQFFNEIGLTKFAIYGSATGAQIAIRYGLEFPKEISHLYLDNAAHFNEDLRNSILKSYFPDIAPKYDGSHLMTIWTMVHDLFIFFPWCFSESKYRLKTPLPPASVLHQIALEYMEAGEDYHLAYRLAFKHEVAEYVQSLQTPTSIFHWEASIVKPYIEQLVAYDFPPNVKEIFIPRDRTERLQKMKDSIKNSYQNEAAKAYQFADFGIPEEVHTQENSPQDLGLDLPPLIPDENGAYLINAWHYLRDRQLFKTPLEKTVENIIDETPHLDAGYLQNQLIKWMKQ